MSIATDFCPSAARRRSASDALQFELALLTLSDRQTRVKRIYFVAGIRKTFMNCLCHSSLHARTLGHFSFWRGRHDLRGTRGLRDVPSSRIRLRVNDFYVRGKIQNEMIHEILPVGVLACNCSILGDEKTGDAVVIDPGDDIERVQDILCRYKLTVKYIVATHAHIDHVGGIAALKRATAAPVLMNEADLPLYQNLALQADWLGIEAPPAVEVDQLLKDGDTFKCGAQPLNVLHTPGHSPGSLCLHLPGEAQTLFSGDTLFQSSIGRTDLWGGSFDQILRSIKNSILQLPDATRVFPGHGPATTIGEERELNPFLQEL